MEAYSRKESGTPQRSVQTGEKEGERMKRFLLLCLALALTVSLCACGGTNDPAGSQGATGDDLRSQEVTVPNNGEWDEILCSGDGYHLVKKEVDAYDGYKFMLGVVNDSGEWVQKLTDTGTFVDEVRFRTEGDGGQILRDSSCYLYLGEGVFLASPGVSVFSRDEEYRVGPWPNSVSKDPIGREKVSIWECLLWNVVNNAQVRFDASKISVFQDGYALFCEEDALGAGKLNAIDTNGTITELPCVFLPSKPIHQFPVYSEGLFFASSEKSTPGFYDIEGNRAFTLSEYDMRQVPFSLLTGTNAPFFEDGQATILFTNNNGSIFMATIDKTGALIGEPTKLGD